MYFIDLIFKKLLKKIDKQEQLQNKIPSFENENQEDDFCEEHVFLPVDSTGEVLACINCGFIVHKKDLHNQNPF